MGEAQGYRIIGPYTGERRRVPWHAALAAYCGCDPRINTDDEAYLSAFAFGPELWSHMNATGSVGGYQGPCHVPWLWFDLDSDQLEQARQHAAILVEHLQAALGIDHDRLLVFFSGSKGFHIGLPLGMPLTANGHKVARQLAESQAGEVGVPIDTGVYDRVRAFRAPNSRHPKTGLHKRRLTVDELEQSVDATKQLAAAPLAFQLPELGTPTPAMAEAWQQAEREVQEAEQQRVERVAGPRVDEGPRRLNRRTREFIEEGAELGERADRLFQAAANLAEFECEEALIHALLTEPALDSGLPPSETERQIQCGIDHVRRREGVTP